MKTLKRTRSKGITRRDMLKASGLALAGLALAGTATKVLAEASEIPLATTPIALEKSPAPGTMRITFCGTWYTPRHHQACNSVFVELGNGDPNDPNDWGDSFVFDCGSGVTANYIALGVPYSRMDKIFLTHLHGDHMSDITTIYCFGAAGDRKTPLHVYGPSRGYLFDTEPYVPHQPGTTEGEGTQAFCDNLKLLTKWHQNSFSFLSTGYADQPVDAHGIPMDGYYIVPHELDYMENEGRASIAYEEPGPDGKDVVIRHFPAMHAREGAISYRLEWNGMSMVFSGDTHPNTYMIENAQNVDILIHEIASHPSVWVAKTSGLQPGDDGYPATLAINAEVIANSHTVAAAFGYIMSQTKPKLAVGTHVENDPDQVAPLLRDLRCFYKKGPVLIANDLLVITASKDAKGETKFQHGPAQVPPYPWAHSLGLTGKLADAKFDGPHAQFSQTLMEHEIPLDVYLKCVSGGEDLIP